MKIVNDSDSLKALNGQRLGMAIGNFDGFHLGHQKIVKTMLEYCKNRSMLLMVMTFVPHPRVTLKKAKQFLINSYRNRRKIMQESGLDILYELDFTDRFSNLSPEEFLNKYVLKEYNIRLFFLGHDFSFGKDKMGGRDLIEKHCRKNDVSIEFLDVFKREEEKVSSSRIRDLLRQGNIVKANELLGRRFLLEGTVTHGFGRGQSMELPTANLALESDLLIPERGVYSTKVVHRGRLYRSLTNIGINPTFQNSEEMTVETHILDFEENIYGEEIEVLFMERMRGERKFQSIEELKNQIKCDISERRSMEF